MNRGRTHGAPADSRDEGSRLHVDWGRCAGRGLCHELLPELVGRDEWGYPLIEGGNDAVVPDEYREVADEAIADCPLAALRWR
ncbi:MAG: ferredoxin [Pseudoclavibacter sp.]